MEETDNKYKSSGVPFCILKTAMTWEGNIGNLPQYSKLFTSNKAKQFIHKLRSRVSAVIIGVNTIIKEETFLKESLSAIEDINAQEAREIIIVIVDTKGRIPLEAQILHNRSNVKVIVAITELAPKEKIEKLKELKVDILITPIKNTMVDLCYLVKELGKRGIESILFEGEDKLNYLALGEGVIDKVISFIVPRSLLEEERKTPVGGNGCLKTSDSILLNDIEILRFDNDIIVEGYLHKDEESKCK